MLTAPTLLSHALIPLIPTGSSIINLSGTFENGGKGWLPYYVSKRAIEDLTIGLADELKDKGINVNYVSPSDTATDEYKRFFPEDAEGGRRDSNPQHLAPQASTLPLSYDHHEMVSANGKIFLRRRRAILPLSYDHHVAKQRVYFTIHTRIYQNILI